MIVLVINIYTGKLTLFSRLKDHPLNRLESLIDWLDLKLNRDSRSSIELVIRGFLTSILIIFLSGVFGLSIMWLSHNLPLAWVFELVCLLMLLDQSDTYKTVLKINKALYDDSITTARQYIANLTVKSVHRMDSFSIARTAIEVLAASLVKNLLAPVFWYILFGFLGIALYHAVVTLNTKIGRKTDQYQHFGITASRINSIILFPPSLLAGCLIVLACLFVPSARPIKSFRSIIMYYNNIYYDHLSIALSAFAGALNLALAGPRKFSKETLNVPWIGDGTAKATHQDIQKSLYLYATVCLINSLIIVILILIGYL